MKDETPKDRLTALLIEHVGLLAGDAAEIADEIQAVAAEVTTGKG